MAAPLEVAQLGTVKNQLERLMQPGEKREWYWPDESKP